MTPTIDNLCLGTMMFGGATDSAESRRIFDMFADAGGRFIDTADTYNDTQSEQVVGDLIQSQRDSFKIATKVGNGFNSVKHSGGLTKEWINEAIDGSLSRLKTDYVDLYYLHLEKNETPLTETLEAIGGLLAAGKIREWGFSNFRPWKIAELVRLSDEMGIKRPTYAQPYYHMLNRTAEADFLPACRHFGIKVVSYSPLARGVLTGKYKGGSAPEGSRGARGDQRIAETEMHPDTLAKADLALAFADKQSKKLSDMAVQWVLANNAINAILAGPRTASQMQSYIDSLSADYTMADEEYYSSLCNPGQLAAAGHFDPRYPLDGRHLTDGIDKA
ncbi:aldo/keto reductase [Ahrensia marina]|uniref:Aldo/keto reductase n=1 Tax=Ahrensia marina TaxID=1514904 RepID=A0A0N0E8G3_9HYPH|nr:aldo/keto reductase [Ahrensia marina]KPB02331.1 aldo/keto reductase [Ahrensia marina]